MFRNKNFDGIHFQFLEILVVSTVFILNISLIVTELCWFIRGFFIGEKRKK